MKKLLLIPILACFAVADGFVKTQSDVGGFISQTKMLSIKDALKLKDDERVVLKGKILREIRHEHFEFSDGSDTIEIEVDDKIWRGLIVTTKDLLEISGEMDKDAFEKPKIDVKRVRKID